LLQQAKLRLAQAHCKRISLDTTQPLKRAIQFYVQNGYFPSDEVTDFFGMPLLEYVYRKRERGVYRPGASLTKTKTGRIPDSGHWSLISGHFLKRYFSFRTASKYASISGESHC